MSARKVLLVEDDAAVREALVQSLTLADLLPIPAASFVVAKDHITAGFDGIILSDIRMPGRDGFHVLNYAQSVDAELPVILLTGEGDIPMAVRAMEQGAFGFLEKPCAQADLMAALERALKTRALVLENRALKASLAAGDPAARMIFGVSSKARALRDQVRRVARSGSDALVTGAPGTGISKVAEIIHLCSAAARAPFVKCAAAGLDVAALDHAMSAAQGGALFIDEIGALPAQTQFHLHQIFEGAPGARVIAGSAAPETLPEQLTPDLYYRFDVGRVHIPPLSARPEDIPVLFHHYVDQAAEQSGTQPPPVTPEFLAQLMAQEWPGNARALMSAAMRFVLGVDDVRMTGLGATEGAHAGLGLAEQMAQVERSLLQAALRRAGGQASAAAEALKLPRKTFYDKLARYGIKPEEYRG